MANRVLVLYKSGNRMEFVAEKFTGTTRGGMLSEVAWEGIKPIPLYFGIDEIEAVFDLGEVDEGESDGVVA
jgi:hypothetical protein